MSRGGASYPDELTKQRYLEESFNKERDTRLRWYFNTHKTKDDANENRASKQYEVLLRRLQASCPKPTEELLRLRREKGSGTVGEDFEMRFPAIVETANIESSSQTKPSKSIKLPPITDMYKADENTRSKIYDGKGADGKGRRTYLKLRHDVQPEIKYSYPVLSSWEYGWRLGDVIKVEDLKNPEFGRSRIVADTFYRNNLDGFTHRA